MAGRPLRRARLSQKTRNAASSVVRKLQRRNPASEIHVVEGDEPGIVLVTVDGKPIWSSEKASDGDVFVGGKMRWRPKKAKYSKQATYGKKPASSYTSGGSDFQKLEDAGYEAFHGEDVAPTLKSLPAKSVVMLWYSDNKKVYFHVSEGILSQITLKGYRPATSLGKLGKKVKKGLILVEGTGGGKLPFVQAQKIVEKARGKKFPKSGGSSSSGGYSMSGAGGGYSSGGNWKGGSSSWQGDGADWTSPSEPYVPAPMAYSTGVVLINAKGQTLLRQPSGFFDQYAWTFAKGRVDPGEEDEIAALRELLEETAWVGEIVATIPGAFLGGTTKNVYFLGKPVKMDDSPYVSGKKGPREGYAYPEWETNLTRWVSQERAREMISETQNEKGRTRDLQVLDAAYALWHNLKGA